MVIRDKTIREINKIIYAVLLKKSILNVDFAS